MLFNSHPFPGFSLIVPFLYFAAPHNGRREILLTVGCYNLITRLLTQPPVYSQGSLLCIDSCNSDIRCVR